MLPKKAKFLDEVEEGYWEHLAAKVAEGDRAYAEGRVCSKEDVRQSVKETLYNAVRRYEKQIA